MLKRLQANGNKVEALENAPVLSPTENFILSAFNFLSASRSVGMQAGAIPLSEMREYHSTFNAPLMLQEFCEIIRGIDREWLNDNR